MTRRFANTSLQLPTLPSLVSAAPCLAVYCSGLAMILQYTCGTLLGLIVVLFLVMTIGDFNINSLKQSGLEELSLIRLSLKPDVLDHG